MVKPDSLWLFFKHCKDSRFVGDVCRTLGGQEVQLDAAAAERVEELQEAVEWHDNAVAGLRERERARKRHYRAAAQSGKTADAKSGGNADGGNGNAEAPEAVAVGVEPLALEEVDISDDAIRWGDFDAVQQAAKITGDHGKPARAFWRRWIRETADGESQFREELFTFRRELQAGEIPDNAGAAFTQRLKNLTARNAKAKGGKA